VDKELLEKKFDEKTKEVQELQKQYQEIGNLIQQCIGELRAYQELFQEGTNLSVDETEDND
jgi:hypothetical protein